MKVLSLTFLFVCLVVTAGCTAARLFQSKVPAPVLKTEKQVEAERQGADLIARKLETPHQLKPVAESLSNSLGKPKYSLADISNFNIDDAATRANVDLLAGIVSMQKQLNELNKKFVKMEIVEARKYKDKTTGELKSATTFKFHSVYVDKVACVAEFGKSGQPVSTLNVAPANNPGDPMAIDMTANANNLERENSKAFLPMLIKAAAGDTNQLKTLIASMSPLNKYFTVDSPEVVELLKAD